LCPGDGFITIGDPRAIEAQIELMDSARRQEIEKLHHAASAWNPDERAARWREACGADDELLREVDSLLAAGDSTQAFAFGTAIGWHRIESILGEGGMGIVYRAFSGFRGRTPGFSIHS
jgi:hypothetical protein